MIKKWFYGTDILIFACYFIKQPDISIMKTAEIHTNKGVMKVQFFEKDAPKTVKKLPGPLKKRAITTALNFTG
ncbi:hypothetical protein ADICEAN_00011 [Cesiribacter andamanensis AMV16]|uniref:Uncharacterized protein n=1 Tax=Cesiribacter andamanensis AMV16 TaxID=1279009 RepID=M7NSS9_9BACT|nr:hypothetical protein ADICEAN_00011 [Cesiribacter andamanensis AMV16]